MNLALKRALSYALWVPTIVSWCAFAFCFRTMIKGAISVGLKPDRRDGLVVWDAWGVVVSYDTGMSEDK